MFKEISVVYSENHAKPINTKCSITDCQSRWFIYLPLGLKGVKATNVLSRMTTSSEEVSSDGGGGGSRT
jgi:hypothetical protein